MYGIDWKISPNVIVKATGETMVDCHAKIAMMVECYTSETKCGNCQSTDIIPQFRLADEYKFCELRCTNCGYRFALSQTKKPAGSLFASRKFLKGSNKGKPKPNGGWAKWDPKSTEEAE